MLKRGANATLALSEIIASQLVMAFVQEPFPMDVLAIVPERLLLDVAEMANVGI